ncbi:MAG: histidine phosphatase family protein [Pseudomonadota bacterium]
MKQLILMRHAKTEPWVEGIDDHARALTTTGRDAAVAMSVALDEIGWKPDLVLVSTSRRTRETWSLLSPVFQTADVRYEDDLYLAGDRNIRDIVTEADSHSCVMIVGHNPGMHDLAVRLVREGGTNDFLAAEAVSNKMPTGAVALFEAEEDGAFQPFSFKLQRFIRPKDLVA